MKKKMIMIEGIFLIAVLVAIYILYPKTSTNVSGNAVRFESKNIDLITLSENPDFSNPIYLEPNENNEFLINLKPGKYYWKASNNLLEGVRHEITVNSEVGLIISDTENESELINVGNVKVNVTKSKEGLMIGHIVLGPEESENIDNKNETYTGRQA